jgi:hypothetical protein
MQEKRKLALKTEALKCAEALSRPDRERNALRETYKIDEGRPLSESTAAVIFKKSGGKKALVFFFWVNIDGGKWWHFIPTDQHLLGMRYLEKIKYEIEQFNFRRTYKKPEQDIIKCLKCMYDIDLRTDDNFNADHSEYQCPSCENWFEFEGES